MATKKPPQEPKLWVTVLKLFLGLVAIVGGVAVALWLALKVEQNTYKPGVSNEQSWGIVNDSPLRKKQ
jgi:hypothetical protein